MAPPLMVPGGPGAPDAMAPPSLAHPRGRAAPPRGLAQRLPWILVGALAVAVAALLAYIVILGV